MTKQISIEKALERAEGMDTDLERKMGLYAAKFSENDLVILSKQVRIIKKMTRYLEKDITARIWELLFCYTPDYGKEDFLHNHSFEYVDYVWMFSDYIENIGDGSNITMAAIDYDMDRLEDLKHRLERVMDGIVDIDRYKDSIGNQKRPIDNNEKSNEPER